MPENCKAHHIFLMAISMHSDPLSPSHNSPALTAARVFISTRVIGVIEHSADSRLFLFFIQMSGLSWWCFPLLLWDYGPLGTLFIHRRTEQVFFSTFSLSQSPFTPPIPISSRYLNLCHFRSGNSSDI